MTTKLIGIPKLAAALGVDQSTVHRRIDRKAIEPTHVADDGRVYWTQEAAQAILHGPVKPAEPAERAIVSRDELASAAAQRAAVYAGRLAVQVSAEPQPTEAAR